MWHFCLASTVPWHLNHFSSASTRWENSFILLIYAHHRGLAPFSKRWESGDETSLYNQQNPILKKRNVRPGLRIWTTGILVHSFSSLCIHFIEEREGDIFVAASFPLATENFQELSAVLSCLKIIFSSKLCSCLVSCWRFTSWQHVSQFLITVKIGQY